MGINKKSLPCPPTVLLPSHARASIERSELSNPCRPQRRKVHHLYLPTRPRGPRRSDRADNPCPVAAAKGPRPCPNSQPSLGEPDDASLASLRKVPCAAHQIAPRAMAFQVGRFPAWRRCLPFSKAKPSIVGSFSLHRRTVEIFEARRSPKARNHSRPRAQLDHVQVRPPPHQGGSQHGTWER